MFSIDNKKFRNDLDIIIQKLRNYEKYDNCHNNLWISAVNLHRSKNKRKTQYNYYYKMCIFLD